MSKSDILTISTGMLVAIVVAMFAIQAFTADTNSFGITICRETRVVLAGKVPVTHYYLVDENNNRRSVSFEVYDSLVTIPECNAVEE